jgi:hypothetical protein
MKRLAALCAVALVLCFNACLLEGARMRCEDNECPEDHCCLSGKHKHWKLHQVLEARRYIEISLTVLLLKSSPPVLRHEIYSVILPI